MLQFHQKKVNVPYTSIEKYNTLPSKEEVHPLQKKRRDATASIEKYNTLPSKEEVHPLQKKRCIKQTTSIGKQL
jgi:hypothetical protein